MYVKCLTWCLAHRRYPVNCQPYSILTTEKEKRKNPNNLQINKSLKKELAKFGDIGKSFLCYMLCAVSHIMG